MIDRSMDAIIVVIGLIGVWLLCDLFFGELLGLFSFNTRMWNWPINQVSSTVILSCASAYVGGYRDGRWNKA